MKKVLVILGPTATGKTDLALKLAKKFNGELISGDSRQVYKGLDIGTGKISNLKFQISNIKKSKGFWEINGVKIWMLDLVSLKVQYNVSRFVKDAEKIVLDISKRGKLPILVGGTGLYIRALLDGFDNLAIPVNPILRRKLEKLSLKQLQDKLKEISPGKWKKLNYSDKQNPRRLLRSIELESMYPYRDTSKKLDGLYKTFSVLKIGLTAPREILYKNADLGILSRINKGMIEETRNLSNNGLSRGKMKKLGLEYGVLADFLGGKMSKEGLKQVLKDKVHGFIKRQLTYFKKEKNVKWFNINSKNVISQVENTVVKWYDPT